MGLNLCNAMTSECIVSTPVTFCFTRWPYENGARCISFIMVILRCQARKSYKQNLRR